jgi:hypothetical protein
MCLVVQQMQAIKSKIALLSLSLYLVCVRAKLSRTVVAMGLATASFGVGQHAGGSKPAGDRYHACISNMNAGTWSRESDSASLTLPLSPYLDLFIFVFFQFFLWVHFYFPVRRGWAQPPGAGGGGGSKGVF